MYSHQGGFIHLDEEIGNLVAFAQNFEDLETNGEIMDSACVVLNRRLQQHAIDRQRYKYASNPRMLLSALARRERYVASVAAQLDVWGRDTLTLADIGRHPGSEAHV